jgi:prenyltransferase beta subunit
MPHPLVKLGVSTCAYLLCGVLAFAAETETTIKPPEKANDSRRLSSALSPEQWQLVEKAVDRALSWLASQQATNGTFPSYPSAQPAVTSLGTMAFLSRGHQPGAGAYGQGMNKAIDFVLSCQRSDGLFSFQEPTRMHLDREASHTAVYNHAISGLMLGEVYGQVNGVRAKNVRTAMERALKFSLDLQLRPKIPRDTGGWRYLRQLPYPVDSDLSMTGWQLMFLRSAKNAEFNVPEEAIIAATQYVRRLWDPGGGAFNYVLHNNPRPDFRITRGVTGAGILCLSMAGQHDTIIARSAGTWLLEHPFKTFDDPLPNRRDERVFYAAYYCSQAMAQLGGHYWEQFFPTLVDFLLQNQASDGSWREEPGGDAIFGKAYSTALAVLSLTPPYQLLPVYQR